VIVVLKPDDKGVIGLNGDKRYIYSALTRTMQSCLLVTIGLVVEENNLSQLVTKHGSGVKPRKSIVGCKLRDIYLLDQTQIMAVIKSIEMKVNKRLEWEAKPEGVTLWVEGTKLFGSVELCGEKSRVRGLANFWNLNLDQVLIEKFDLTGATWHGLDNYWKLIRIVRCMHEMNVGCHLVINGWKITLINGFALLMILRAEKGAKQSVITCTPIPGLYGITDSAAFNDLIEVVKPCDVNHYLTLLRCTMIVGIKAVSGQDVELDLIKESVAKQVVHVSDNHCTLNNVKINYKELFDKLNVMIAHGFGTVKGVRMTEEEHIAKNNVVGSMIRKYRSNLLELFNDPISSVMWITNTDQSNNKRAMIKNSIPTMSLNAAGKSLPCNSMDELTDALYMVITLRYRSNMEVAYYGTNQQILLHNGLHHADTLYSDSDKLVRNQLEVINRFITKDVENLNSVTGLEDRMRLIDLNHATKYKVVYISLITYVSAHVINNLNTDKQVVFVRIPSKCDFYRLGVGNNMVPCHCDLKLRGTITIGSRKYTYSIVTECGNTMLLHLGTIVKDQIIYVNDTRIGAMTEKVKCWWLNAKISEWLSKGIFEIRTINMDTNLYRKLRLRLMTGSDSWNALMDYMRSLASAYFVSDYGIFEYDTLSYRDWMDTAYIAYVNHHNVHKLFINYLNMMMSVTNFAGVFTEPVLMLVNKLSQLLSMGVEVLTGAIKKLIMQKPKWMNANYNGENLFTLRVGLKKGIFLKYAEGLTSRYRVTEIEDNIDISILKSEQQKMTKLVDKVIESNARTEKIVGKAGTKINRKVLYSILQKSYDIVVYFNELTMGGGIGTYITHVNDAFIKLDIQALMLGFLVENPDDQYYQRGTITHLQLNMPNYTGKEIENICKRIKAPLLFDHVRWFGNHKQNTSDPEKFTFCTQHCLIAKRIAVSSNSRPRKTTIDGDLIDQCNVIFTLSRHEQRYLREIYNREGVITNMPMTWPRHTNQLMAIDVLFAARYEILTKGWELAFKLMVDLHKLKPDIKMLMIMDNDHTSALPNEVKELIRLNTVTYLKGWISETNSFGPIRDIHTAYSRSKVYFNCSLYEPGGMAGQEAYAHGCGIVVNETVGWCQNMPDDPLIKRIKDYGCKVLYDDVYKATIQLLATIEKYEPKDREMIVNYRKTNKHMCQSELIIARMLRVVIDECVTMNQLRWLSKHGDRLKEINKKIEPSIELFDKLQNQVVSYQEYSMFGQSTVHNVLGDLLTNNLVINNIRSAIGDVVKIDLLQVNLANMVEVFNSEAGFGCVKACCDYISDTVENKFLTLISQSLNVIKEYNVMVLAVALLSGMNCCMTTDKEQTAVLFKVSKTNKCMVVNTVRGEVDHVLLKMATYKSTNRISDQVKGKKLGMSEIEPLGECVGDLRDYRMRVNIGINLYELYQRRMVNMAYLEYEYMGYTSVSGTKCYVYKITQSPMVAYGITITSKGWMNWLCYETRYKTMIMMCTEPIITGVVLFALRKKMQRRIIHGAIMDDEEMVALNAASHKLYTQLTGENLKLADTSQLEKYKKIYCGMYDNRSHHKFRTPNIDQYPCYVLNNLDGLEKLNVVFSTTTDKPVDRLVINRNRVKLCMECSSENVAFVISVAFDLERMGKCVYSDVHLNLGPYFNEYINEPNLFYKGNGSKLQVAQLMEKFDIDGENYDLIECEELNSVYHDWHITEPFILGSDNVRITLIYCMATNQLFSVVLKGKGVTEIGEKYGIWAQSGDSVSGKDKWLNKPITNVITNKEEIKQRIHDATSVLEMQSRKFGFIETVEPTSVTHELKEKYKPYISDEYYMKSTIEFSKNWLDMSTSDVIDLWNCNDLTWYNWIYSNAGKGSFRSKENAKKIAKTIKYTMSKYPMQSRPVLTKLSGETTRAVSYRLYGEINLRKGGNSPEDTCTRLMNTCFTSNWQEMCKEWCNDLLMIDRDATLDWIATRPDYNNVMKEYINVMLDQLSNKPLKDTKIHLKLESLLKDNYIMRWCDQKSRIIVWQKKALAAVFSPVFVQLKKRLKLILDEKIVYTDGLTPKEISKRVSLVTHECWIYESDASKQDRQTDEFDLKVEYILYARLGVHESINNCLKQIHDMWRFKTNLVRGHMDNDRHTGSLTTAIGNVIVNLQVLWRTIKRYNDQLELVLILGDDNLLMTNCPIDKEKLRREAAAFVNMQVITKESKHGGKFCQMMLYNIGNTSGVGCDVVRLHYRYEVLNGVGEANSINLANRKQSYQYMLGMEDDGDLNGPRLWFDRTVCYQATAEYYGIKYNEVLDHHNKLVEIMEDNHLYAKSFIHWKN
jgi:hypothetical protein